MRGGLLSEVVAKPAPTIKVGDGREVRCAYLRKHGIIGEGWGQSRLDTALLFIAAPSLHSSLAGMAPVDGWTRSPVPGWKSPANWPERDRFPPKSRAFLGHGFSRMDTDEGVCSGRRETRSLLRVYTGLPPTASPPPRNVAAPVTCGPRRGRRIPRTQAQGEGMLDNERFFHYVYSFEECVAPTHATSPRAEGGG